MLDVLVVAHTHWDREWYHPEPRFRVRLVALVDELLDHPDGGPFLLDGQAILLDDYLAVRPERADALARALGRGEIESGPWYVLADLLIPGGEALVRNLLAGRRVLGRLGAHAPDVLYAPDAFGHPAMLPAIADGFGCPVVVLWRGYGGARSPAGDVARWRAPDGSAALICHLPPDGYEFGSSLPVDRAGAAARWAKLRAVLAPRATLGAALLTSGADHHARQRGLSRAIDALARAARPDRVRRVSLERAATEILKRARAEPRRLPEVRGELRDSYGYTWTLQGTLGSRAALKRINAQAERALVRDAEPWLALARRAATDAAARDRRALAQVAWRRLLENHPHDTLCGTVADSVAASARERAAEAMALVTELRESALLELAGHDVVEARDRPSEWEPRVLVRNAAARRRSGVATYTLVVPGSPEPVGPGSPVVQRGVESPNGGRVPAGGSDAGAGAWGATAFDRVESPLHYPGNARVSLFPVVAWVDGAPGYSVIGVTPDQALPPPGLVRVKGTGLENDWLTVAVDRRSEQRLASREGEVSPRLLAFELQADAGDLYTPSLRGRPVALAPVSRATQVQGGLRGGIRTQWQRRTRGTSARTPAAAAGPDAPLALETVTILDADARFVRVIVRGDSAIDNARLRIVFDTGLWRARVVADAAFGPVARGGLMHVEDRDLTREAPVNTAPLHRYVSLYGAKRGVTIYSDGLAEYEALPGGRVAVTLVRAVGALSYADLPERPGHAAWPVNTPAAQSHGPFAAEFAVFPHGPDSNAERALVERTADDVLLPLTGFTVRAAIAPLATSAGVELEGEGLALGAIKDAEHGDWLVLRCVNVTSVPVRGAWRLGFPVAEARLARLDETPLSRLKVSRGAVPFTAPPRGIVTVLAR